MSQTFVIASEAWQSTGCMAHHDAMRLAMTLVQRFLVETLKE
jgi:hypothetical protein